MDLCVVGCGRWGKNIIRTLVDLEESENFTLTEIVHTGHPKRKEWVRDRFDLDCHTNLNEALRNNSAVCIATPDETHPRLVEKALENDTDVFVEKPLAFSEETAIDLIEKATDANCLLMPGHLMVYHPVVEVLNDRNLNRRETVDEIIVTRFNNLRESGERRLLHSSLIHDLSMLDTLFNRSPDTIDVLETLGPFPQGRYLSAKLTIDTTIIRIRARTDCPFKERSTIFRRGKQYFRFNGLEESFKIAGTGNDNPKREKIVFESLPLTEELRNFIRSVQGTEACRITLDHVRRVMHTLERFEQKIG